MRISTKTTGRRKTNEDHYTDYRRDDVCQNVAAMDKAPNGLPRNVSLEEKKAVCTGGDLA